MTASTDRGPTTAQGEPDREAEAREQGRSSAAMSVARTVVVTALALQFVLTVLQILVSYAPDYWVMRTLRGDTEAVLGSAVLVVLLALTVPAARGRRWALALATVIQLLLTAEMVPWLLRKFGNPENFLQWFLNLSYCVVGAAAVVFGGIALLETWGRSRPARWGVRGGSAPQVALLLAVLIAYAGALAAGAGIAQRELPTSVVPGAADEALVVNMHLMSFTPTVLELPAGKRVGLVLVNHALDDHAFDLDAQNIHVRVPGRSTAFAMVEVPLSGRLPFYCGVPGHTEAGMTGVIVPAASNQPSAAGRD